MAALREAWQIYTPEQLPQQRVVTQNSLIYAIAFRLAPPVPAVRSGWRWQQ